MERGSEFWFLVGKIKGLDYVLSKVTANVTSQIFRHLPKLCIGKYLSESNVSGKEGQTYHKSQSN